MTNPIAVEVANHIKEDRQGANYYYDPKVLADYLKNSLNITEQSANEAAQHIREDRDGADYYKDVKILAQYLEGRMRNVPDNESVP